VKEWATKQPTESQLKLMTEEVRLKRTDEISIMNVCLLYALFKCKELSQAKYLANKLILESEK
jgi:hypothetical protein